MGDSRNVLQIPILICMGISLGSLPLRVFASSELFTSSNMAAIEGDDCDQRNYLVDVLSSNQVVITVHERPDTIYEVYEGWCYVNALIRFFKNEIPLRNCRGVPPAMQTDANVSMHGTGGSTLGDEDYYYHKRCGNSAFASFIDNGEINVVFV